MRIHMVSLEDGVTAIGLRKMAAFVERLNSDTHTFFIGTRYRSFWKSLTGKHGDVGTFDDHDIDLMAEGVAGADIVALSSMTGYSALTRELIHRVRKLNPKAYIIWGGIHPIIYPEDAITAEVDAICVGEGELPFAEFLYHYERGSDYTNTLNFWFKNKDGEIKRNGFRPLMSAAELETLPFTRYGGVEWMFRRGKGFGPMKLSDYLHSNGLGYPVVWSIGCPLHCTYCGNTVFIQNDPAYKKIRHPSASYIIREIQHARRVHPHLRTAVFHDDSFMALHLRDLTDFATQWREKIGIPFVVYGIIPSYVKREKLEVLTWAGMNRVRMGIQSGSERILKFFKRPTPVPKVEESAAIIAEFSKYHIPASYDMIVDNPIETRQDVLDTLELVYRLARPFKLGMFSLKLIPNTELARQMEEEGIDLESVSHNFHTVRPTVSNVIMNLLIFWRPPRWMFDWMLKHVRAYNEPQRHHPILLFLSRIPWGVRQVLIHIRFADYSTIPGYWGYVLWKTGVLKVWDRLFGKRMEISPETLAANMAG